MVGRDGGEDDSEGPSVSHTAGGASKTAAPADVSSEGEEFRPLQLVVGVGSEVVDGSDGWCD